MTGSSRQHRAWLLALVASLLTSTPGTPGPDTVAAGRVALPPVSAAPAVALPETSVSPEIAAIRAQLARYEKRSGLTPEEQILIADVIVAEAKRHDLDPQLVLAVMHVESRYDTYAVSTVNAMGLMQILPSTGAWLAPMVGVAWAGPQTLFDPVSNVRLGTAYLRMLADRYDGRIDTALAAYNWGPGTIDRRLRNGTALPTVYPGLVRSAYDVSKLAKS